MRPTDLRIPGPTPIPPAIMRAMQRPMISHRGPAFRELHLRMLRKLKEIHQTEGDMFVLPGSGSVGWEAAIVNTLAPGDQVLAFVTGEFGNRFASVAERFQLDTIRIESGAGCAADAETVSSALDSHPNARAVLYTWNETATGVTNPLPEIGPLVREHGALLFVDAVSAAGALELRMDEWAADIVLSGSQKAWMCPPGMSIIAVGNRARDAEKRARFPRAFLDLARWRQSAVTGDTPSTGPLSLYYGLDVACDMILSEGINERARRHAEAGELTRNGLQEGGLTLLADPRFASDTVTAARMPGGLSAGDLVQLARKRYHVEVAAGQGALADEIIRIGHMGWFDKGDISRAVAISISCLRELQA